MARHNDSTASIWAAYGATVALALMFALMPGGRVWGLNWYRFFSWYGPLILIVAAAITLWLAKLLMRRIQSRSDAYSSYGRWATVIIAGSLLAWIGLSARTHFLGDGLLLLSKLQASTQVVKPWDRGSHLVVTSVYDLLGGGESAELAYRLISYSSGALFIIVAALCAARLFNRTTSRILFLLGLASGGYTLLFFGYVENYPPFVALFGAAALAGLAASIDKLSRWWIVPPALLAAMLHPFAIALLPAALYILVRGTSVADRWMDLTSRARTAVLAIVAMAVLAAFIWLYNWNLFLQLALLAPWSGTFTVRGYTLFSISHLLDFANLLIMLLPGLALLLWLAPGLWKEKAIRRSPYVFINLLVGAAFLVAFVFDPKLGMARDWDLFSFIGVPLALLLYYGLLDERRSAHHRELAAVAGIALGLLLLMPRAVSQVVPETALEVFDSYDELYPIRNQTGRYVVLQYLKATGQTAEAKQREIRNARLAPYEGWDTHGQQLIRDGHIAQAESVFRKVVTTAPTYSYSWANIGLCFIKWNMWDSALVYLKIADGLNPFNSDNYNTLGYIYLALGDSARGEDYCRMSIELKPANFTARGNLMQLYESQNRRDDLVDLLTDVVNLDSLPDGVLLESAGRLLELKETEAAARLCRRALELNPRSEIVQHLQARFPGFDPNITSE